MKKLGYLAAILAILVPGSASLAFAQEDANPVSEEAATTEEATPADPAPAAQDEASETETKAATETTEVESATTETSEATEVESETTETTEVESETIEAADADGFQEIDAVDSISLDAAVEAEEDEEERKPFGAFVAISHSVGSGMFVLAREIPADDPTANQMPDPDGLLFNQYRYAAQSWDLRASYNFEAFGQELTATARGLFDIELTTPDTNPVNHFEPYDLQLYLTDAEIYKEPFTDIAVAGRLKIYLPLSRASLNVTQRWLGVQGYATLSRSVGPVDFGYTFSVRKNFNGAAYKLGRDGGRSTDPFGGVRAPRGGGNEVANATGMVNTEWDVQNSFAVTWNINEQLSVGYSLLLWNLIGYPTPCDEFTAANAQCGVQNLADFFWPTLEVDYALTDAVADYFESPVAVSLALGVTSLHPVQSPSNRTFYAPVIFNSFGPGRSRPASRPLDTPEDQRMAATNGFGSIYFDVVGTY